MLKAMTDLIDQILPSSGGTYGSGVTCGGCARPCKAGLRAMELGLAAATQHEAICKSKMMKKHNRAGRIASDGFRLFDYARPASASPLTEILST
jgi:hypothetical protein